MKGLFSFLLSSCLFFSFALTGEIFEISHFKEVVDHIKPESLLILDIDDTLLIPQQTLGSDAWFRYRIKQLEESGLLPKDAFSKTLAEWQAIRHVTKVKIVEEGTDTVIRKLQKKDCPIMGLTLQNIAVTETTVDQLRSLHIDLSKSAPHPEDLYFKADRKMLYHGGILFTSGTAKGNALLTFLDEVGIHFDHVILVDDRENNLKDVEKVLKARDVDFIGLRYSYNDARVAGFRKEIADIQHAHSGFDYILSDEEAEELLQ